MTPLSLLPLGVHWTMKVCDCFWMTSMPWTFMVWVVVVSISCQKGLSPSKRDFTYSTSSQIWSSESSFQGGIAVPGSPRKMER